MIDLRELVNMAIENFYDCYIYNNAIGCNVWEGILINIPDEYLKDAICTSWELELDDDLKPTGRIGFNCNI